MQIEISKLRLAAFVGIYPHEYSLKQPLEITVTLNVIRLDWRKPITLEDTVDYACVAARLSEIISGQHFELLEHLLGAFMAVMFDEYKRICSVEILICKPLAIEQAEYAGVKVFMTRDEWESQC